MRLFWLVDRILYAPMPSNLSAPLIAVLDLDSQHDTAWLNAFNNACTQCVEQIDILRPTLEMADRDVRICLDAVRNCLDWATNEVCSVAEAHALIHRVLDIISSISETV